MFRGIVQLRMICALAALIFASVNGLQAGQPMLRMFTTEDGLARNWVKRIRRDRAGRLWFCTELEGVAPQKTWSPTTSPPIFINLRAGKLRANTKSARPTQSGTTPATDTPRAPSG